MNLSNHLCHKCGKSIDSDAKFCDFCGQKIKVKKPSKQLTCEKCKSPLDKSDKFCTHCGNKIESLASNKRMLIIFGFFILTLGIVLLIVINQKTDSSIVLSDKKDPLSMQSGNNVSDQLLIQVEEVEISDKTTSAIIQNKSDQESTPKQIDDKDYISELQRKINTAIGKSYFYETETSGGITRYTSLEKPKIIIERLPSPTNNSVVLKGKIYNSFSQLTQNEQKKESKFEEELVSTRERFADGEVYQYNNHTKEERIIFSQVNAQETNTDFFESIYSKINLYTLTLKHSEKKREIPRGLILFTYRISYSCRPDTIIHIDSDVYDFPTLTGKGVFMIQDQDISNIKQQIEETRRSIEPLMKRIKIVCLED